jgi:plastocyanin
MVVIPYDTGDNESLNFQPANITVVIGVNNTVTWVDQDSIQHTVVSTSVPPGAQKFNSGILNQSQEFTITLTVPGTYHYYCDIHPTWMKGTITVLP